MRPERARAGTRTALAWTGLWWLLLTLLLLNTYFEKSTPARMRLPLDEAFAIGICLVLTLPIAIVVYAFAAWRAPKARLAHAALVLATVGLLIVQVRGCLSWGIPATDSLIASFPARQGAMSRLVAMAQRDGVFQVGYDGWNTFAPGEERVYLFPKWDDKNMDRKLPPARARQYVELLREADARSIYLFRPGLYHFFPVLKSGEGSAADEEGGGYAYVDGPPRRGVWKEIGPVGPVFYRPISGRWCIYWSYSE